MGDNTHIQWSEATWNPTVGCTRASRGCDHCYAVRHTVRMAGQFPVYQGLVNEGKRHFNGVVRTVPERLAIPLGWRRPRRIFVDSMSDLFHPAVPFDFIARVWQIMRLTPQHTYQILTKRPERMAEFVTSCRAWSGFVTHNGAPPEGYWRPRDAPEPGIFVGGDNAWPLPNVWLGTSVEDQAAADERIPHLLRTPAAVRFLSCEPLLGPLRLWKLTAGDYVASPLGAEVYPLLGLYAIPDCDWEAPGKVDWVIVGGESGPGFRPCDIGWIRDVVKQCKDEGTAVFVKQLGAAWYEQLALVTPKNRNGGDPAEWPMDLRVREFPGAVAGAAR